LSFKEAVNVETARRMKTLQRRRDWLAAGIPVLITLARFHQSIDALRLLFSFLSREFRPPYTSKKHGESYCCNNATEAK
jgi:hypothetical protein